MEKTCNQCFKKMAFVKCDCRSCDRIVISERGDICDCDSSYEGSWVCRFCERREEREHQEKLKKTCNQVIEIKSETVIKNGKIIKSPPPIIVFLIPHGGKPICKGKRATIDINKSYLKEDKNGCYLVI